MTRYVERNGTRYRTGDADTVAWITGATPPGLAITAAVPPVFEAYATSTTPAVDEVPSQRYADEFLAVLGRHTPTQPWWLGYLDTGAHDVVFADEPRTTLYAGWGYVLVEAGPAEATRWRAPDSWRGPLPDLMFPADRSWLVSLLWDDDWRCVGGSRSLIDALAADPVVAAREVDVEQDATPPGFEAR